MRRQWGCGFGCLHTEVKLTPAQDLRGAGGGSRGVCRLGLIKPCSVVGVGVGWHPRAALFLPWGKLSHGKRRDGNCLPK